MNFKAKVEFTKKINEKIYVMRLRLVDPEEIDFKAGQFVSIDVGGDIRRSYSIASDPDDKNFVDIYNDIAPMGPGSKFFLEAKDGQEVSFLGPLGQFHYEKEEEGDLNIFFIATGTGVAPVYSMLLQALDSKKENKIHLFFGLRYEKDQFLVEELRELEKKHPNFQFHLTLSKPSEDWKGLTGHVTHHIEEHLEANEQARFYICGSQKVISSTEELLLQMGISADNIHYERFY